MYDGNTSFCQKKMQGILICDGILELGFMYDARNMRASMKWSSYGKSMNTLH